MIWNATGSCWEAETVEDFAGWEVKYFGHYKDDVELVAATKPLPKGGAEMRLVYTKTAAVPPPKDIQGNGLIFTMSEGRVKMCRQDQDAINLYSFVGNHFNLAGPVTVIDAWCFPRNLEKFIQGLYWIADEEWRIANEKKSPPPGGGGDDGSAAVDHPVVLDKK